MQTLRKGQNNLIRRVLDYPISGTNKVGKPQNIQKRYLQELINQDNSLNEINIRRKAGRNGNCLLKNIQ